MATNSQAQAAGFATPAASDLITDGDDTISQNARATLDLVAATNRTAISERGVLSGTADTLDALTSTGFWEVLSGTAARDLTLPGTAGGHLIVRKWGSAYASQEYVTSAGTWQRWKLGTAWSAWKRTDVEAHPAPAPNSGTASLTDTANINTMTTAGSWSVLSAATATALSLPIGQGGVLEVIPWGRYAAQVYRTAGGTFERWQGSTAWWPWKRVDTPALEGRVAALEAAPASSRTMGIKTLPVSLTLAQGSGDGPLEATVRVPVTLNAPVTRWRLRIANRNPRYSTTGLALTNPVTFSELYVGTNTGAGTATDLTRVAIIPNIPDGQSATVTPWISAQQIGDNRKALLSFGYTTTAAPRGLVGGGWLGTSAADAAATSPAGITRVQGLPFQMWLEVETPTHTPALAGFGDSLSCGVSAALPVHDSWLSQYCRKVGAIPVHYAGSGDYMGGYEDPTLLKWVQWADLDRPDAVIWAMGSNDVFGGATLDEMKRRHAAVAPLLARYVSPVQYAATIMPRTKGTGDVETTRRAYNEWLRTLPNGIRDLFDFAASMSDDDETIRPEFDGDGIHLTTSGYAANAAAITRPVTPPRVATI